MKNLRKKFRSLAIKIPALVLCSFLFIIIIIGNAVYFHFNSRLIYDYTRMAEGAANLAAEAIDGDLVDKYMKENRSWDNYNKIEKFLTTVHDNYPDMLYLYVYKIDHEGAHVVFDLDTEGGAAELSQPGEIYKLDEPFASMTDKIMAGEEIPAITVHTRDNEYLLSYLKPVYDSDGNYACSIGVDFSMDHIYKQDVSFVTRLAGILFFIMMIVLTVDIIFIRRTTTNPLIRMQTCLEDFSYETEDDRMHNIQTMEELNITNDNETGDIYNAFLAMIKESFYFMTNLEHARRTIKDNEAKIRYMGQAMFKDPLTGVGNKAAYVDHSEAIDEKIKKGNAKYAVVMADVNNLKYINDTFGHERGDEYIKSCCKVLCDIYEHSPVYRIGGDEFVIVLMDNDYERCQVLIAKAMISFNNSYKQTEKEPWERLATSLGMAKFNSSDKCFNDTFKRADSAMYEAKLKFKEKYGSYR